MNNIITQIIKGLRLIFIPFEKISSNALWLIGAGSAIVGVFAGQDEFTFEAFFSTIGVVLIFRFYSWKFDND